MTAKCYINGVSGSLIDEDGNNLLHLAVQVMHFFTNSSINHRFFQTNSIQVVRAVLLLFGYKYDLFSAENKEGRKPIQSTFSQQIVKCIKIMEKNYKSGSNSRSTTTAKAAKKEADDNCGDGTATAISKKPGHILLSLDGGGIRGLVLVRVSSFSPILTIFELSQFSDFDAYRKEARYKIVWSRRLGGRHINWRCFGIGVG